MADESIIIAVKADTSGAVTIKRSLDDVARSADRTADRTDILEKQFRGLGSAASLLKGVLVTLGVAMAFESAIEAGKRLQQLENRMLAATKSAGTAAASMAFVRETADRLGLAFTDAADGFAGFAASALRSGLSFAQTKQIFSDVATAAASLQLPAERVQLIFKALEQIAGKGTVQMEELKGQLGDSLPGAVEIAAKSMGVTTAQLMKLIEQGKVASEDFLPKFAAALKDELGGAAVQSADSLQASTNRLKTAFFDLQAEFAKSGAADAYKLVINGLADLFKDPEFLESIRKISGALLTLTEKLAGAAGAANEFFGFTDAGKVKGLDNTIDGLRKQLWQANDPGDRNFIQNNIDDLQKQRTAVQDKINLRTYEASVAEKVRLKEVKDEEDKQAATDKIFKDQLDKQKKLAADQDASSKAAKLAAKEAKKQQTEITTAIKGSMTEQEKLTAEIGNLERLRGLAKTKSDFDALTKGIANTKAQLAELAEKAEMDGEVAKTFKRLADQIDDGLQDAFADAFSETEGGWEKMLAGMKATFTRFLADLAYQAVVRPIVLSVLGAGGQAAGLSNGAISSILGTNGGGFSLSSLSSLGSAYNALSGGLNSVGAGFVNTAGASLGFYNAVPSAAGVYGPVAPGAFGTTTLGGALAGGGLGIAAAQLLGLGNKNPFIATGAGIAGGAAAAGIGAALGAPLGPLGIGLGAFAGTALSGLFGGGTPRQTLGGEYTMQNGRLVVTKAKARNAKDEQAQAFLSQTGDLLNQLADATGSDFLRNFWIDSNIGKKDKKTRLDGRVVSKNAADSDAIIRAIFGGDSMYVSGGNADIMAVLRKSLGMGSSGSQALSDIGLAKSVLGIDVNAEAVAKQLKNINTQFEEMTKRAIDLGLPIDKVTAAMDKQREAAIGAVKAMQAGFSSLEEMTNSFKAFLDGQALGTGSSLNPLQKLQLAQSNYDDLLKKVQGGDSASTKDLLSSASTLLDVGRSTFASSQAYADLEGLVRSDVRDVGTAAGVQGLGDASSAGSTDAIVALLAELLQVSKDTLQQSLVAARKQTAFSMSK